MLKPDSWIIENSLKGMIQPFEQSQISKEGLLSFGVSSYGYDVRLANELKVATNLSGNVINPKKFNERIFHEIESKESIDGVYFELPPKSFALGHSIEHFDIPRNICVLCVGKSTYARCGLSVPITPLEPEWRGYITLEFANTTDSPIMLFVGEGVAQLLFFEGEICNMSYKDRGGKYQDQVGITLPR